MNRFEIIDIKPFIGAKDYEASIRFYTAIGFVLSFKSEDISELELDNHRIYLQNYYDKTWCDNSMLHIMVKDANAWYERVSQVLAVENYSTARVEAPRVQDYGALVTFVWDPSGVLLHFAQITNQAVNTASREQLS